MVNVKIVKYFLVSSCASLGSSCTSYNSISFIFKFHLAFADLRLISMFHGAQ